MEYILSYFVIYAFFGWILEVVFQQLTTGRFVNRGMLAGPYCPIYGIGVSLLIIITKKFDQNFLMLFIVSSFICSLLEYVSGFLLEKIFHERWWDYSDEPFNLHGYICLRFSIAWGLAGAIVIKEIHPFIESFVYWLPYKLLIIILIAWLIGMFIDFIVTVNHILGLNKKVDELILIQNNMRKISDDMGMRISNHAAKASSKVHDILDNPEFKEHLEKVHERLNYTQRRLLKAYPNLKGTRSKLQNEILKQLRKKNKDK